MEIKFQAFLNSTQDGGKWSASRLFRFIPGTSLIVGRLVLRAALIRLFLDNLTQDQEVLESFGIYCRVVKLMSTDVSEVRAASIIRELSVASAKGTWLYSSQAEGADQ
jgi:hypothetical protein